MKWPLLVIHALLLTCLGLGAHFASAQTYTAKEVRSDVTRPVPEAIGKKFRDLIPNTDSTSLEWLWVDSLYIANCIQEYQSHTVKFKADGRLRDYARIVNIDTLPVTARKRIAREMWKQEKLHPTALAVIEAYYDCESGPCAVTAWSILFFKSYEDVKKGIAASVFSRSISSSGHLIHRQKYTHFRF